MQRFVEETGRTGLLSVWGEGGAVCVRWYAGHPPVMTSFTIGSVMPLLFSATGRVFLSFLSAGELAGPLAAARAEAPSLPDVEAIMLSVRQSLLAESDDVLFVGLRTMAAPIFDLQGRASLVATAVATSGFPRTGDAAVAERLRAACRDATIEAGGVWPG
jgi:DNA-binding IclR family transcriptional regulator